MLTIITTPKPLSVESNRLAFQNAIRSWVRLVPRPEILVFGGDRALVEHEGGRWIGDFRAVHGRPYFDDFISRSEALATNDILMYCTDHLVLTSDLSPVVGAVSDAFPGHFVVVGKRRQLHLQEGIDFSNSDWEGILRDRVLETNFLGNNAAKDYIIFRRPLGLRVPDFIMGYPWYDTWFVWAALQANYPVVDATHALVVIHQKHGFSEGSVDARERTPGGQHNRRIGKSLSLDGKGGITHAPYVVVPGGISRRS